MSSINHQSNTHLGRHVIEEMQAKRLRYLRSLMAEIDAIYQRTRTFKSQIDGLIVTMLHYKEYVATFEKYIRCKAQEILQKANIQVDASLQSVKSWIKMDVEDKIVIRSMKRLSSETLRELSFIREIAQELHELADWTIIPVPRRDCVGQLLLVMAEDVEDLLWRLSDHVYCLLRRESDTMFPCFSRDRMFRLSGRTSWTEDIFTTK